MIIQRFPPIDIDLYFKYKMTLTSSQAFFRFSIMIISTIYIQYILIKIANIRYTKCKLYQNFLDFLNLLYVSNYAIHIVLSYLYLKLL